MNKFDLTAALQVLVASRSQIGPMNIAKTCSSPLAMNAVFGKFAGTREDPLMSGIRFVKTPGFYCPEPMCGRLVVPNVRYRDSDGEEIIATINQMRFSGNGRSSSFRCSTEHGRAWRNVPDEDLVPLAIYASFARNLESRRILGKQDAGIDEVFPVWCIYLAELEAVIREGTVWPGLFKKDIRTIWKAFDRGKIDRTFRNGLAGVAQMADTDYPIRRAEAVREYLMTYPWAEST